MFGPLRLGHVCAAGVVILVVALSYPLLRPSEKKKVTWAENPSFDIRIEVQNGCGTEGVAEEVGSCLRDAGFDIVGTGNADAFDYEHTLVIDRCGLIDKAVKVGKALRCERVIVQRIAASASDVVVVVGSDWANLEPVREWRRGKGIALNK
ncbi:MAG: LytR C-terminal domain-containing protein [Candidatus Eisenbacteria bacterium]|nr:LytR C-terminal domain-containing protein [Candidatus Eisenbacteria bacterium]